MSAAAPVEGHAQLERTLLAWHRTTLAALANAALLARAGVVEDQAWPIALGVAVAAGAALAEAVAVRRYATAPTGVRRALLAVTPRVPAAAALGAAAVAAAALALATT